MPLSTYQLYIGLDADLEVVLPAGSAADLTIYDSVELRCQALGLVKSSDDPTELEISNDGRTATLHVIADDWPLDDDEVPTTPVGEVFYELVGIDGLKTFDVAGKGRFDLIAQA